MRGNELVSELLLTHAAKPFPLCSVKAPLCIMQFQSKSFSLTHAKYFAS